MRRALANFFWPPVENGDYLEAARRRCLIVMCFAAALVGFWSGTRNFEASMAAYPLQTWISIAFPVVFLLCPIVLAITNKPRMMAYFFLGSTYCALMAVALIAGGMFSRTSMFMLPSAMIATLLLGWRHGIGVAAIIFGSYYLLHSLHPVLSPSVYEDLLSVEMLSYWLFFGLSLTLLVIITGAAIFQREMEHAAIKLSEALAEAKAADQAKTDFLANMSHEIRTPINGILGMSELLNKSHLDSQQKIFANTISASSEALLAVINDILDLSKIEAGNIELEKQPINIDRLFAQIESIFSPQANEKEIKLSVEIDKSTPPVVLGDANKMRQILMNLAGNALKFTDKGCVKISVSSRMRACAAQLQVCIEDTGVGIPSENLDRIFDKFSQVETSTNRRFFGSGLGLSISQNLAAAMGGDIKVCSIPGSGSIFTFEVMLPLPSENEPGNTSPSIEQGPATVSHRDGPDTDGKKYAILAAEDNEVNRLVLKSMIAADRYDITFATDGREAVELFKAKEFDTIVMDISMPNMDGFEATEVIRAYEAKHNMNRTPIICLTAHALSGQHEICLKHDMDDYISKPIRGELVNAALRKWTDRSCYSDNYAA